MNKKSPQNLHNSIFFRTFALGNKTNTTMKTEKELRKMSANISKASFAYQKAVVEKLKESSKEHKVIDEYDEESEGLTLRVRDTDVVILVDKVRWNNELNCVEYHTAEWNFKKTDTWTLIHWLAYDDINRIYDAIEW